MKSIHVFPFRIVISLTVLLATLTISPASAGQTGFTVGVERNGQPLAPYQVVLHAAADPKPGTVAGDIATFDADVVSASLDGKRVAVFVDECEDGRVGVQLVLDDPNVQPPVTPANCRRRRIALVIIRSGSRIAIDVGRGTAIDASSNVSANDAGSSGRRLGIGAFGGAGGAWGGFNLSDPTGALIGQRFTSGNPPYQQYTVDVDDSASGFSFGGGVDLAFGGSSLGARVGLLRESERDAPRQSVNGERIQGGLRFQQLGTSAVRAWTLYAGPTVRLPLGVVISGGPSFTFWDIGLTQTAQLQAGCPAICATVRSDNLTERSSGSDLGLQLAADYYPGDGWIGMHVMYLLTTYHGAYDPSRPLGYPRNWRDSNVFVGAVVRTPQRRR